MICDHDTITNVEAEDQYILVYCDSLFIMAGFTGGLTSSAHTIETFNTAQALLDRGIELGLDCTIEHLIKAMEHGATLPGDVEAYLLSVVWDDNQYTERMKELGYTKP